jgi:hypothetical protein
VLKDSDEVVVHRVDSTGVFASAKGDLVLDVNFDGRRVWSFWVLRDSEEADSGNRFVAWPKRLGPFLDGKTRLTVVSHVDSLVLYDEDLSFGTSEERISVVDSEGRPLGMDKSGRLQRTFDTRSAEQIDPLLDAIEEVLDALRKAGIEAFPAYGTLLGAVRNGKLIGHDSDADLAYVSTKTVPVDVIRESFALQGKLAELGYRIRRYSGAGFKVVVTEADGSDRGLDVFGGFFSDGHLIVLGEIRVPFREEWIRPLATTTLEGRELPAPADTDRFLAATYGPSWRVPDPAFVFETPESTHKRLNDWFRGTVVNRASWDAKYAYRVARPPQEPPAALARLLVNAEPDTGLVIDIGCGRGHSARWLARRGVRTVGLDYSPPSFKYVEREAEQEGLPLSFAVMNLLEMRHVLAYGAKLAHVEGPRSILACHIADALDKRGRGNLWRFARMAGGPRSRMYVDFLTAAAPDDTWPTRNNVTPLDPAVVTAELTSYGARVVSQDRITIGDDSRIGCRMVIEWNR